MGKENNKLAELWNEIAPFYSKLSPNYWGYFGKRLVEKSIIRENGYVLDIGTGRGAVLFPISNKVGDLGHVIGIDFSENMVNMTNDEINLMNIINSKVVLMDMKELDFKDEYFDNIISGFSLGCILNDNINFKNLIRILKKGGQLSFTMWGKQKDEKWLTDIVNKYIKPTPNKKQSNSIDLNSPKDIRKIVEDMNLKEIKIYEEEKEVVYLDEEQWWEEMYNNAVRNIFKAIEKLGQDTFNKFKEEVEKGLQDFKKENGICINMNVMYIFAQK